MDGLIFIGGKCLHGLLSGYVAVQYVLRIGNSRRQFNEHQLNFKFLQIDHGMFSDLITFDTSEFPGPKALLIPNL
jgi:hypothetical protein